MTTIGIDPGLAKCGWAIWNDAPGYCPIYDALGFWKTDSRLPFSERLAWLAQQAEALLRYDDPSGIILAIETQHIRPDLPSGVGRSVLQVAQVAGAIQGVAETLGVTVVDVSPQRAKLALAGKGDATKEDMLEAVLRRYGLRLPKSAEHAADALGMALAGASMWRFQQQRRTASQVYAAQFPAARAGVRRRVIG